MTMKKKTFGLALKSIFFSIRDALAYRNATRDPGNRDITSSAPVDGAASVDVALQLSTVWSCVRLIAETIATLPLLVYQREGEGRMLAREHPLFSLLHDSPNADMTAVEFWEAVVSQLCLWGNSYCLKTYGFKGKLVALDPLNPAFITPARGDNGQRVYKNSGPTGSREYSEDEIWHVKGFGTTGLEGLSPISLGWRSMAASSAAERAASDLFTNNMRPAATVAVKEYLKPDQREAVKKNVMGAVFGNSRTGQLQLLEGGAEYKQLTLNPVDAQVLESRAFSVEDLCRWFQVPPAMIGHGTMVSNWGTGREQIMQSFVTFVLRPYMVRIEQGIKKSLIGAVDRTKYFAEYSLEGLLRADSTGRAAFYVSLTQNGVMSRNEVRALENWPPAEGGDELTVQSNLIPLTLLGKITSTAPQPEKPPENDDETPDEID